MRFTETAVRGAWRIDADPIADARGSFTRTFSAAEFAAHGLNPGVLQCNLSFNRTKGTLRGMHYQADPWAEAKLVRCTAGALYDVVVDLRPDSPTFKRWDAVELEAGTPRLFYIPEGCAHGFQTLADGTELFYQVSREYRPDAGRGVRWNDPAFGIRWPLPVSVIADRDAGYPDWAP